MAKQAFYRKITLIAGILAVAVILLSQTFQREACTYLSKIKTEKTEKAGSEQKAFVAAPSDAVTSGQAAEKADADPTLIREILLDEGDNLSVPAAGKTILASFLKTLFRTVISPQAP